jgi:pantetheine-phosphate adenylyltransferase
MEKIIYPGTFDPLTWGHVDIVKRASHLFETVVVAIAAGHHKTPLFALDQRVALATHIFSDLSNVAVMAFSGLFVDFMKDINSTVVLRGIRTTADMEYEFQLAAANRSLTSDVETLFLKADPQYSHISASLVREIAQMGGELDAFVPAAVIEALRKK